MASELITNEQVETAAEAAWANYMGFDPAKYAENWAAIRERFGQDKPDV